jgi:hypothetical protein
MEVKDGVTAAEILHILQKMAAGASKDATIGIDLHAIMENGVEITETNYHLIPELPMQDSEQVQ